MFEKYRKANVYIGKTKMSISVRIIVQNFEARFGAFLLVSPITHFCSQSLIYIPFLANYPLRTVITVLSESIRRKTLFLKFSRIPHTHGVFRHFSTSLRRVPRRWRGPTADRATSGGRSAYPKVLEPVHFGAKHRRRNQYFIVHILVHF